MKTFLPVTVFFVSHTSMWVFDGRCNASQFIFGSAIPDTLRVLNKGLIDKPVNEWKATESCYLYHTRAVTVLL